MNKHLLASSTFLLTVLAASAVSAQRGGSGASSSGVIVNPWDDAGPLGDPGASPMTGCNAEAALQSIGQVASTRVVRQLVATTGAASVRVLRLGEGATREFLPGRLNLIVDRNNVIRDARCG